MSTTAYGVPDDPSDPETATLELIVRIPAEVLRHDSPPRDALQHFASLLNAEGCFAGMAWADARHAANRGWVESTDTHHAHAPHNQRVDDAREAP